LGLIRVNNTDQPELKRPRKVVKKQIKEDKSWDFVLTQT